MTTQEDEAFDDLLAELESAFDEGPPAEPPAKRQRGAEPPAGPSPGCNSDAPGLDAAPGGTGQLEPCQACSIANKGGEGEEKQQQQQQSHRQQQPQQPQQPGGSDPLLPAPPPPPSPPPPAAEPSPLSALSDLLMLRVLANLSPEDLLLLGQTSQYFRAAAGDGTLWRRLYYSRWPDGPQQDDAEHVQGSSWRLLYLERDQQAVLEARQSAPSDVMLPIYLQMATARRSEALSATDAEGLYRSPVNNRSLQLSTKVDAFRRQRGLLDAGKHARHGCQGGCSWAQLENNAWICENSGFVHVCNAECAFRELGPSNDMLVCTISGRCFANMLTDAEEHAGEQERGQGRRGGGEGGGGGEQEIEDWAAEDGISGRLGRAFYAGYNAETPEEFFRSFGVRF